MGDRSLLLKLFVWLAASHLFVGCDEGRMETGGIKHGPGRVIRTLDTIDKANLGNKELVKNAPVSIGKPVQVLRMELDVVQDVQLVLKTHGLNPDDDNSYIIGDWLVQWGSGNSGLELNRATIDSGMGVSVPLHCSVINVVFIPRAFSGIVVGDAYAVAFVGKGTHNNLITRTIDWDAPFPGGPVPEIPFPPYAKRCTVLREDNTVALRISLSAPTGTGGSGATVADESLAAGVKGEPFDLPGGAASILVVRAAAGVAVKTQVIFELSI
jgi:hypothetical protein